MIKKLLLLMVVLFNTQPFLFSQEKDTINEREAGRIIRYLASDSMMGRGSISPEVLKAGMFIRDEFRKNGLQVLPGAIDHCIPFHASGSGNFIMDQLTLNGIKVPASEFRYFHPLPGDYPEKNIADFEVVKYDNFFNEDILDQYTGDTTSLLLWTDKPIPGKKNQFPDDFNFPKGGLKRNVLLVYSAQSPASLSLKGFPSQYLTTNYNVVGVLPGRSRPNEAVIFSAHYDHMGVYGERGDTILNGANDNASGTTALLLLAEYFSKRNDNERTILFCAFAAEELGLFGSKDLVQDLDPAKIVAGINLEMLGVPQYGKNRVFILGSSFSDLPRMLEKGLRANQVRVISEPHESKQLFQRSDNYPFALQGIPFHTIMASDDDDACYHRPCDEVKRIDIPNMTKIIKAISRSVIPIIQGGFTPQRIYPSAVEIKD